MRVDLDVSSQYIIQLPLSYAIHINIYFILNIEFLFIIFHEKLHNENIIYVLFIYNKKIN